MQDSLTAFIVGSSWPAFVLFFMGFHSYDKKFNKNNCIEKIFDTDPYYFYTILAPVYMGTMSMGAVWLHNYYNISIRAAFLIISLISASLVAVSITVCDVYNFSQERLIEQYLRLIVYHLLLYNLIIATLYEAITQK